MTGRSGSASTVVAVIRFILVPLHRRQHGVEALVALLGAGSVPLDPRVHQVEGFGLQAYGPGLAGRADG